MDTVTPVRLPKLGLFSWDVIENKLTADEVYAEFYDINPDRLVAGLSIEQIIGQIAESDREGAARATHTALITGKFSSLVINIERRGITTPYLCYGRCLRDGDGVPTVFTGGLTEYSLEFQRLLSQTTMAH